MNKEIISSRFQVGEEFLEPGTKNSNYKRKKKRLLNSTTSSLRTYLFYEKNSNNELNKQAKTATR